MEEDFQDSDAPRSSTKSDDDWNYWARKGNSTSKFVAGGILHSMSTSNKSSYFTKPSKEAVNKTQANTQSGLVASEKQRVGSLQGKLAKNYRNTADTFIMDKKGDKDRIKSAHLEVETNDGCKVIALAPYCGAEGRPVTFGRENTDVQLEHFSCSRRHAQISCVFKSNAPFVAEYFLSDLGSANGTLLNDGKLPPHKLNKLEEGDEIKFGHLEYVFMFHEASDGGGKDEAHDITNAFNNANKAVGGSEVSAKRKHGCSSFDNSELEVHNSNKYVKNVSSTKSASQENASEKKIQQQSLEKVSCKHILLKHRESRNPFDSYRQREVKRTKEEAYRRLAEIEEILKADLSQFQEYALEFSECSSAKKGGDLGFFRKGQMQEAFEAVAFALEVGKMSTIVETKSGLHLIFRTA